MKSKLVLTAITLSLICFLPVKSQTDSKPADKYTLLTMPYNQRQLTLYKGQLQANAGYKFALRSHSFDDNGDAIDLKKNGNSSVLHYYFVELKYGVLDYLELGIETSYMRQGIRAESTTYMSYIDEFTQSEIIVTSLNEFKGIGDMFLYTSLRLPIDFKKFDFKISGGMSVPVAKYEPEKPSHSITDIYDVNNYTVNYHFNNRNGIGVPVYQVSATAKFTFSRLTAEADFTFRDPLKEGTSIRWDQTMINQSFFYSSSPYKYLPDRTIMINASIHYQTTGWFNIYMNSRYFKTSKGWTEYWGLKFGNPQINLLTLEPGYEMQISPSLKLYQIAGFALTGRNSDAPFYLVTKLSYNIFPFKK
jgi:hypothetical protein